MQDLGEIAQKISSTEFNNGINIEGVSITESQINNKEYCAYLPT